jgi:hypothetical protein
MLAVDITKDDLPDILVMPGIVSVILAEIADRFDIDDGTFKIGFNILVEFLNQSAHPSYQYLPVSAFCL